MSNHKPAWRVALGRTAQNIVLGGAAAENRGADCVSTVNILSCQAVAATRSTLAAATRFFKDAFVSGQARVFNLP
ncbi:hypothetical protein [Desulfobacter postgatei]|uniref:hypothetical protein n=1 Tax=Desulfobacter postgatei TaxID=2293 RepID=UPI00259B3F23|nr:hypothetical protein [uncultured Desulfobacter sp.]